MEQFGNEVAGSRVGDGEPRSLGQTFEFLEILFGDVLLLNANDQVDPLPRFDFNRADLDEGGVRFHFQDIVHVRANFFAKQCSVLETHLARRPFQVQNRVAIDQFEPTFAATGHRLSRQAILQKQASHDEERHTNGAENSGRWHHELQN